MNIQWYPGHMTKAVRMMEENMKLIDLVIEILDARIPYSSRNPDIDRLAGEKMRLVILNKADLSDENRNREWLAYFESKGIPAISYNSKAKDGMNALLAKIKEVCREKIERDKRRGIINRSVKAMIVGIPNVGKSTFINNLAKRNAAVVGNKPGVTKGKQWIHVNKELDLLDTPGILWPKFDDPSVGLHIGFIGSINDEILSLEELAMELLKTLEQTAPGAVWKRYGSMDGKEVYSEDGSQPEELPLNQTEELPLNQTEEHVVYYQQLKQIAIVRKCYKKGDEPDLKKAADLLLDDFRSGKLGKITLEFPPE